MNLNDHKSLLIFISADKELIFLLSLRNFFSIAHNCLTLCACEKLGTVISIAGCSLG